MEKHEMIILVTGATGKQGGAVARALLQQGWSVRALTRNTDQPAARDLAERGAAIIRGDLRDRHSVDEAIGNGVYGVFSVQTFMEGGVADEVRQGKALADAARDADIQHFIYSSVSGADRDSGVPFFESKWEIEQYIRSMNLPATIFRPVFFMENLNSPNTKESVISEGKLALPFLKDQTVQLISVEDIAAFVSMAFEKPEEYIGRSMEIAGDELTMNQAAHFLTRVVGRRVQFQEVPIEEVRARSADMAKMFEFLNSHPSLADIPMLRQMHPELMSFETWLSRSPGWTEAELKVGAQKGAGI